MGNPVTDPLLLFKPGATTKIDSIKNRKFPKLSSGAKEYHKRQLDSIIANGGTEADLLNYMANVEELLPGVDVVSPEEFSVEPMETVDAPGFIRGMSMRALQGITFGFGDEAMGGLLGVLTGQGARKGIEEYRSELKAWSEQHPTSGIAAELAGAFMTGGVFARGLLKGGRIAANLAKGQGLAAGAQTAAGVGAPVTVTQGAGIAAAAGATFAAGNAEELPPQLTPEKERDVFDDVSGIANLSGRAKAAIFGFAAGGTLGAGLGVIGAVAAPVVRQLGRLVTPKALQRAAGGAKSPQEQARILFAEKLKADNISPQEMVRRALELKRRGITPTAADLGGDNVMALAREMTKARTPQIQRLLETLGQRQAEQGERLTSTFFREITRGNKMGLSNVYATQDLLKTERLTQSMPFYQRAWEQVVDITPEMKRILKIPQFRAAYERGKRIADLEDAAGIGHGLKVPGLPKSGAVADQIRQRLGPNTPDDVVNKLVAQSGISEPSTIPVRALDYMKRGIDEIVEKGFADKTLGRRTAQILRSEMNKILRQVDERVDDFAKARAIYHDATVLDETIELGMSAFNKAPGLIAREVNNLQPGLRDFYRLGYAQKLYEDVLKKVSGTAAERTDVSKFFGGSLFGQPSIHSERMKALWIDAPEVAEDFMRMASAEARISAVTAQMTTGKPRFSFQAAEEALEGAPIPQVRATPGVFLLAAGRQALERTIRRTWQQDVSDELTYLFTQGLDDPLALQTLINNVQSTTARRTASLERRAEFTRRLFVEFGLMGSSTNR